jgi:hypothetical protein
MKASMNAQEEGHAVEETREHRVRRELDDPRDAGDAEQNLHRAGEQDAQRQRRKAQIRIVERRVAPKLRQEARLDDRRARARRRHEPRGAGGERRGGRGENGAAEACRDAGRDVLGTQGRKGENASGETGRHGGRDERDASQRLAPQEREPARRNCLPLYVGHRPRSRLEAAS